MKSNQYNCKFWPSAGLRVQFLLYVRWRQSYVSHKDTVEIKSIISITVSGKNQEFMKQALSLPILWSCVEKTRALWLLEGSRSLNIAEFGCLSGLWPAPSTKGVFRWPNLPRTEEAHRQCPLLTDCEKKIFPIVHDCILWNMHHRQTHTHRK